jgi:hypothetical protein
MEDELGRVHAHLVSAFFFFEKVLLTPLIYYRSLILVPHPQNRVSEVTQLSNLFIFGHLAVLEGGFHMI